MNKRKAQPHLILPELSFPKNARFQNEGIGVHQPLATEVIKSLLDLGLDHAVINKRHSFSSNWNSTREFHLFSLLLEGEISYSCIDGRYTVSPGELIFCPAHSVKNFSCKGKTWFIYFEFEERPIWEPLAKRGVHVRKYESTDLLYLLVKRIADAYSDRSIEALNFAREDAKYLTELLKREVVLAEKKPHKQNSRIQNIAIKICRNPSHDWTLKLLASEVHVSVNTLNRLFVKAYGLTPMEMVIRERMIRAGELLVETDEKIISIADQLGYESMSSFSRLFKKHMGRRPGQYRDEMTIRADNISKS